MDKIPKLLINERNQAAYNRFILPRTPANWRGFFAMLKGGGGPSDFLDEKERDQAAQDRDPFEGWKE